MDSRRWPRTACPEIQRPLEVGTPMREGRVHSPDGPFVRRSVARNEPCDAAHGLPRNMSRARGAKRSKARSPARLALYTDGPTMSPSAIGPSRKVRVLFINDTTRNGGPGRSLESILKFLDPSVVHRAVILPRAGAVSELLAGGGVTDEVHLEPNLVENPIEPWSRAIERSDFGAPLPLKALRAAGNAMRAIRAVARLRSLVRRRHYDLIYCNGTTADFAGAALAQLTGVPALWHVRYTSIPPLYGGCIARSPQAREWRGSCASRAPPLRFFLTAWKK